MINKLKSFLTIILAYMVIMNCFTSVSVSASEVDIVYNDAELFAMGIDAFNEEYYADAAMSRGTFAEFISNISGLISNTENSWRETVFADDNKDQLISATTTVFEDVDTTHPQYDAIMAVYSSGYMHGVSQNRFAPDYNITVREATKVFVDILQYGELAMAYGGFPNGYVTVAQQKKLLKGVSAELTAPLTQKDAATILYNALDVPFYSLTVIKDGYGKYTAEPGQTFMTKILGLDKIDGRITDNGLAALTGDSKVRVTDIVVGGITLETNTRTESVKRYIGREITAYYTNDEDNYGKLIYYVVDDDEEVAVITATGSPSAELDGNRLRISYVDGYRKKSEAVLKNANVIYNNKVLKTYDESIFDIKDGDITLIATSGGVSDLVVIRSYEHICVDKVDSNQVIYGKGKGGVDSFQILNLSDDAAKYVSIRDENNNIVNISELVSGDVLNVLRSSDGKNVEIIVSRNTVEGFVVVKTSANGDVQKISNDEMEYTLLRTSQFSNAPEIELKKTYRLYLNKNGEVVWFESTDNASMMGILMVAKELSSNSLDDKCGVKIYDSTGKAQTYTMDDKFYLNGEKVGKPQDALTSLQAVEGEAVLYTTNSEGLLKSITTAAPFGSNDNQRGWYRINPKPDYDIPSSERSKRWYLYNAAGRDFSSWIYYVPGYSKVFTIPTDDSQMMEEKNFTVDKFSFVGDTSYAVEGFATDKYAVEAEVLVLRQDAKGSGAVLAGNAFVITNISLGYDNEEDEVVKVLNGYLIKNNSATETTLNLTANTIMVDSKDVGAEIDSTKPESEVGPRKVDELRAGDIVAFGTDSQGRATVLCTIYDHSTGKTFKARQGVITGFAGYAYSMNGNAVRLSLNNPEDVTSWPENTSEITGGNYWLADNFPFKQFPLTQTGAAVTVEEAANGTLKVYNSSVSDIMSYADTGSVCDWVVAIEEWHGKNIGTVIYKNNN